MFLDPLIKAIRAPFDAITGRARAVGNIMKGCRTPGIPCHRVVAAAGRLGGYGGNEGLKRALLAAEGVSVGRARIRDFDRKRFIFRN